MPRTSVKTTTWRNKPNTAAQRAARANNVGKSRSSYTGYLKKSLQSVQASGAAEMKFVDVLSTGQAISTTVTSLHLNPIAEGNDNNSRQGRRTDNVSLQLKGVITCENITLSEYVRVIVFIDKQSNGAAPPQILQNPTSFSLFDMDYRDRIVILRDYEVSIDVGSNGIPFQANSIVKKGQNGLIIDDFIKLGFTTTWQGTAAPIANIQTGAIWIQFYGQRAVGATNPQVSLVSRVKYRDP